jgi:hypothetical protein
VLIVAILGILFLLIFLGAPVFLAMIAASLVHWVDLGRDSFNDCALRICGR